MNVGAEYSFNYASESGILFEERQVLFTGLTINVEKAQVYIRGLDVNKKQYRTFRIDRVDLQSVKHVRG
jgi:predicted DNA-binding transcriptional regulator YafY